MLFTGDSSFVGIIYAIGRTFISLGTKSDRNLAQGWANMRG